MMTAAGRPDPATSPTTRHSSPDGRLYTSYQSPPTPPLPGMCRAASSAPATAGSAVGTGLRCSATAARRSACAVMDCTAAAARSAASCRSSVSWPVNWRCVSDPTCSTPITLPPATIGTPIMDWMPLAHKIGLSTVV